MPRVAVADRGGEELEEAARRMLAGVGDDTGHDDRTGYGEWRGGGRYNIPAHGPTSPGPAISS